ncbi:unnamed protein product [Larinioides sclopetarius]|uniref:Uncharacterized protein n=1 Tax=Larinioides sclopetarius TaxID=280406 RepID=A0AAV1ZJ70_9ARAC
MVNILLLCIRNSQSELVYEWMDVIGGLLKRITLHSLKQTFQQKMESSML